MKRINLLSFIALLFLLVSDIQAQQFTSQSLLGGYASVLGLHDFDGDNDLDMFCEGTTLGSSQTMWWVENIGNNVYATVHCFQYPNAEIQAFFADEFEVLDFDQDGDQDIMGHAGIVDGWTGAVTYSEFYYFENDGQGNFTIHKTNEMIHSYTVTDMDNDGILEVYATYNKTIVRYDWTGAVFQSQLKFTAAENGYGDLLLEIDHGDMNGDDIIDLVFLFKDSNYSTLRDNILGIYNTSSNTWTATTLTSGHTGSPNTGNFESIDVVELADSDYDGDLDLYFNPLQNNGVVSGGGYLHMKRNNGNGTFGNFCSAPYGNFSLSTSHNEIVQLGNDMMPDFLTFHKTYDIPQSRKLYRNVACSYPGTGEVNYAPTAADHNNDGHPDLYQSHFTQNPDNSIYLSALSIELGDGYGNFEPATDSLDFISPDDDPTAVGTPAADFDNNGSVDFFEFEYSEFKQIKTDVDGCAMSHVRGNLAEMNGSAFHAFEDMNNDGFKDVVYVASDAGMSNPPRDVYVLKNINGTFLGNNVLAFNNTTSTTNSYTRAFEVMDSDNDGDKDILIYHKSLSQTNGKVYLVKNLGNWNFAAAVAITGNIGTDDYTEIEVFDMDNDGDKDFYIFGKFYRNNGSNNFVLAYTTTITCTTCEVLDLDGDGDLDVASYSGANLGVQIHLNAGDYTFALSQSLNAGEYGAILQTYDFDADGTQELYIAGYIFKWVNGAFEQQVYLGPMLRFLGMHTLPDGRTVSWISYGGRVDLSYDFVDAVNCLSQAPVITELNDVLTVTPAGTEYQWWNCDTNQPISGENSSSFVATEEGSYRVEYHSGNCPLVSDCAEVIFMLGDVDSDNQVAVSDLLLILENFGCVGENCIGDLNGDGITGSGDIIVLMALIGG